MDKIIKYKISSVLFGVIFIDFLFMNPLFAKEEAVPKDKAAEIIIRPHIEYKAAELRDPFKSPREKKETEKQIAQVKVEERPLPNLVIEGIVWGGNFPQAIINNKVVKIEDTLEEARIIDIKRDGVTVSFDNRLYNLSSPAAISASRLPVKKP